MMTEAYGKTSSIPDPEAAGGLVRTHGTRPGLQSGLESGETGDRPATAISAPDSNIVPVMDNKTVNDVHRNSTEPTGLGSWLARLPKGVKQALPARLRWGTSKISYLALYRYADIWDLLVVATSALCAIAAGAALPLLSV